MKEYIAEYIVPVEKKGNDCTFDFMNAKPLIRCKDCGNWKPTETDEEIGECVILSKLACYICRTVANYYCAMAQPKDKNSETES